MTNAGPSTPRIPPRAETFATFHTGLQAAALKATRASAGLPVDLDFYKSVDGGIKKNVDRLEGRVLELLGKCIALADGKGKGKEVRVEGEDLVDDFHGTVVDFVDVLLEKTDICLDEYSGKLKRPAVPVAPAAKAASSSTQKPSATTQSKPYLPASLQHAATLSKPQLAFPRKIDNLDDVQTRSLKHKYNARVPLGYVLQKEDLVENFAAGVDDDATLPSHPYYFEITHLQHPPHVFTAPSSPSPPPNLPAPVTYVSTSSQFSDLLAHLTSPSVREIAVDLEHHSYRTYRGFLCLMQLTTRSGGDFIVDLLSPKIRSRMHELNEVFTNPNVVKVFHGAESDIVWLQQDFGVYVVGLFDTFHASKLLELPKHGLATLLELYADYTPDKKYQLADWRIRPLPEEMLHYAQSDTHWLLYLYDRLRGALADKEVSINSRPASRETSRAGTPVGKPRTLLAETLFRSSQTSLRQYTPEVYDSQRGSGSGGWDSLAKKWNKTSLTYIPGEEDDSTSTSPSFASTPGPTKVQRLVYRAVHRWRDAVAREEDESTRYVLPNHFLFTLAENAPADMNALLGMFRGGGGVPPVVRRRAKDLLETIREAVRRGLEGPKEEKEKNKESVGAAVGQVETPVLAKEDEMVVDGRVDSSQSDVGKDSGLWGPAATTSNMITKSSSLLGTTSPKSPTSQPQPLNTLFTSKSALFGSVLTSSAAGPSRPKPAHNPDFKALVSKINSTLVIAPSVPKILASASTHAVGEGKGKEAEMEVDFDPALGMHIDAKPLAYVPAAQRTTLTTASTSATTSKTANTTTVAGMEDMGPIVVVGRKTTSNRKKRKREQQASTAASKEGSRAVSPEEGGELGQDADIERGQEGAATTSKSSPAKPKTKKQKKASPETLPQAEEDDAPYDFTATPNVLDQGPPARKAKGLTDSKGKKGKGGKGKDAAPKGAAGYFYSPEFGAPPKQRSDFKGGNKSHTFKG